ncbi:MAG: hypothetical protein V1697_00705, partial [Candidatus Levyibacteriota bacterium]
TTCINNVCAIPPTTSSTIPGTPPACGTACTTPANCNTARDGCTTCVGGTCTQPFNPASCTCDNITYSALFSGQDVTITSFSKITGADVSNAKVVSEKFHMAKGNTTSGKIIAESDDIPSKIIQSSSSTVRYETQWQFKLPQLETGATYRIWSDINCQPITSAKSYNVLQKMAVLGAETKTSFIDTILGFFNNIVQNVSNILKSEDDSKKTIQLETLKPAVVIEKGCSTIIFRQD